MTYAEIKNLFNLKLDKEVNAYFSDTEIATILNSALYRLLEDRYRAFESSSRISQHLSPLTQVVYKQMVTFSPFIPNTEIGWVQDYTSFNVDSPEFPGWLYVLDLKLVIAKNFVDYNSSAVETTSSATQDKTTLTIPARKINIDSNYERDPYIKSNLGTGVSNEKLDDAQVNYQLVNNGIKLSFPNFNGQSPVNITDAQNDFFVWDSTDTRVSVVLTCIVKPTEFTSTNLNSTTQYTELTEAGQRDLVNYAIQITSEITREKDEYQYISSEIQKDLL